ncbi:MAG: TolC family protein, partial [bacterium]
EAGEGIRLDELETGARLKKLQADLREAKDRLEIARAQLLSLAGLPAGARITLADPAAPEIPAMSLDEAVARAAGRIEFEILNLEKSLAQQNAGLVMSAQKPQVALVSGYQLSGRDSSLGDQAWRLGFSVTYDLGKNRSLSSNIQQDHSVEDRVFLGGIYSTSMTQRTESLAFTMHDGSSQAPRNFEAAAAVGRASMDIAAKRLQFETQIREAYLALQRDAELIDALDSLAKAKEEALKARRAEYEIGLGNTSDLIDAENDLIQAKSDLIRAGYARLTHQRDFLYAIGREPFPEPARRRSGIEDPQGLLKGVGKAVDGRQ